MLPVVEARSFSDDNAIIRSCTSSFVDDVVFPNNGANRLESKTTRTFRPVCQEAAPVGRNKTLLGTLWYSGST